MAYFPKKWCIVKNRRLSFRWNSRENELFSGIHE